MQNLSQLWLDIEEKIYFKESIICCKMLPTAIPVSKQRMDQY